MEPNVEVSKKVLPNRLIVNYGSNPQDVGLLISTPGSTVGKEIKAKPNCSAGELSSALASVLLGTVNLADDVKASFDEGNVWVAVRNPRLMEEDMWIYRSIGTPVASIVASIVAQVLNRPVVIERQILNRDRFAVELKFVEREK